MINEQNVAYLKRCIDLERIPHSLLLAGPSHSPKEEVALDFAHQLLGEKGQIPDLYVYRPEGKLGLHLMETMREFRDEVYMPPYQHSRKVLILFDAERMQAASANSLLKTFEEPLETSIMILVSSFPEKILPTIRSRCQILYFQGTAQSQLLVKEELLDILRSLHTMDHLALLDKIGALAKILEEKVKSPELEKQEGETAQAKLAREKEGEGQEAMSLLCVAESIWVAVLSWYRDQHARKVGALPEHLFFPHEAAQESLPSLEAVSLLVENAKRSLERSGPLKHVLESFFLALKRI
jgi:DNA polymerase III subunit delta'